MPDQPQNINAGLDQFLVQAMQTYSDITGGGPKSFFGYGYSGGFIDDQSIRAKYYPQLGETYDAWLRRMDADFPGFGKLLGGDTPGGTQFGDLVHGGIGNRSVATNFSDILEDPGKLEEFKKSAPEMYAKTIVPLQLLRQKIGSFRTAAGFKDPNNLGQTEGAPQGPQGPSGTDIMRMFAMEMLKPVDVNDPYVKSVINAGTSAANREAANRGINGGLAVSNTENAATQAALATQMQRNQLGLQALGTAEGLNLEQAKAAQAAYMQQWQAQNAQLQQAYQSRANEARGTLGLVGGAIGGVAGAYFGGPAGAQAGFSAGSQLGAGLGGMSAGAPPSMPYNPPSAPSRGGLSGSGY